MGVSQNVGAGRAISPDLAQETGAAIVLMADAEGAPYHGEIVLFDLIDKRYSRRHIIKLKSVLVANRLSM